MNLQKLIRLTAILLALSAGIGLLVATGHPNPKMPSDIPSNLLILFALLGIIVGSIPVIARLIERSIDRFNIITSQQRIYVAIFISIFSAIFLFGFATYIGRPMRISWHDEHQFHLQTQMLARFKLWMPGHPLADFFDTFYVFTQPYYASQSFPGASILFALSIWLHLPIWMMPLICVSACSGLTWWLIARYTTPTAAAMGCIVFLSLDPITFLSTMWLAQFPVLFLGLIGYISSIKLLESKNLWWACLLGISLGWAAITRPLDALIYAVPITILLISSIRAFPIRQSAFAATICLISAIPFLTIQIIFNHRITGSYFQTPFSYYNQLDQPALAFAGSDQLNQQPRTKSIEKLAFYDMFTKSLAEEFRDSQSSVLKRWSSRFDIISGLLAPFIYIIPLAAIGILGVSNRYRLAIFLLLPLFLLGYHFYPIFLSHYIICAIPAILLLHVLSYLVIERELTWISRRISTVYLFFLVFTCFGFQFQRSHVEGLTKEYLSDMAIDSQIRQKVFTPAIVLFKWSQPIEEKLSYLHYEPVYNDDVAWPDDAPVIRAHDLGSRNIELFNYYAKIQPERAVWSYDRSTGTLVRLGNVRELAQNPLP